MIPRLARVTMILASGLLALAVLAIAQPKDTFGGTWRLNVAKSKYSPGPPAKSTTVTYEAAGPGYKVSVRTEPACKSSPHPVVECGSPETTCRSCRANLRWACAQESFGIGDGARLGDGRVEGAQQVGVRIDADQLRGLAERVEERRDLRASERS
jgi:threonine dehydrogenase-like Zn-dependent dehydrogenase